MSLMVAPTEYIHLLLVLTDIFLYVNSFDFYFGPYLLDYKYKKEQKNKIE